MLVLVLFGVVGAVVVVVAVIADVAVDVLRSSLEPGPLSFVIFQEKQGRMGMSLSSSSFS